MAGDVLSDDVMYAATRSVPGDRTQPIVHSPALRALYAEAARVAASDMPIVVLGESGAGKEVLARYIHDESRRAGRSFCAINSGAIPADLSESILFGHARGAFTGADRTGKGIFDQADGGTLLLDEVADLSLAAQCALLRVLETGMVRPVGGSREHAVDVRLLAATNADLETMVAAGKFREDLFYRIAAVSLIVPPLRERPEDAEALAEAFVRQAGRFPDRACPGLSATFRAALRAYAWPGNARELRNAVERALVLTDGVQLDASHLPARVQLANAAGRSEPGPARARMRPRTDSLFSRMDAYEARLIEEALQATAGNRAEAAARLRVPLRTFMRKLSKHRSSTRDA